jgi:NAD+ kinase
VKLERVSMVVHHHNQRGVALEAQLSAWLHERSVEVTDEDPDLVLALGGDGTVLRAAHLAHSVDAPLLGVNFGSLGYLTEVDPGGEVDALERIYRGSYAIEERMMLTCRVGENGSYLGLNEVLVERSSPYRLVRLAVSIGGEHLSAFNADGVMVATPTGSTAYALSAGGPIVDPRAECLLVVPVSPHMIFARPFVLMADETVAITVTSDRGEGADLSLDGSEGCHLEPGTTVHVRRHHRPLKMVKLAGPRFIERLRAKLSLPDAT